MPLLDRVERMSIEPVLDVLDAVRLRVLKRGSRVCAPIVRDRDRRLVLVAVFACATALAATAFGPGYMLLLGPIVLGVPHLFFEARYLFFQHAHLRRVSLVAILGLQTLFVYSGLGIYTLGVSCAAALIATGAIRSRNGAILLAAAALAEAASLVGPTWSRFLLLHAHNCIPIVVWLFWRRRPLAISVGVTLCFAACVASILVGCFDGLALHRPFGDEVFSITKITDAVAGGFGGAWRHRSLRVFCFTQATHYAVWLRMIPEEARSRATPRSWRASWRAYKRDSGPNVARLMLLATVAVPVIAIAGGVVRTRALYVTVSEFHATVEVLMICVVVGTRQLAAHRIQRPLAQGVSCEPPRSRSRLQRHRR